MDTKLDSSKEKGIDYLINITADKDSDSGISKYCVFLGSGCSCSSGIPMASELVKILRTLVFMMNHEDYLSIKKGQINVNKDSELINKFIENHKDDFNKFCTDYEKKFKKIIKDDLVDDIDNNYIPLVLKDKFKKNTSASSREEIINNIYNDTLYSRWFEEYSADPRERQFIIEELIYNIDPYGSYVLLANLIKNFGLFTNIFTTNFDDLINDALLKYVNVKSKVYAHKEIAKYISFYSKKPNIIKLHGDYLFQSIKNTQTETNELEEDLRYKLEEALKRLGLIVIGYSGSDNSVMDVLTEIKNKNKFPLFWCIRREDFDNNNINWRVIQLINKTENSFFVLIEDFDLFIFTLWNRYGSSFENLERLGREKDQQVRNLLQKLNKQNIKDSKSITTEEKISFDKFIDSMDYRTIADNFLMLKEYDNAIKEYSKAIELAPKEFDTYINRGISYGNKGQYDKAIEDFNTAIELNPKHSVPYIDRGKVYIDIGQYDKAIEDCNKAIELNPKESKAYNNRGLAYGKKGQYDKAIEDYNTAIELNPIESGAYINRGLAYIDIGQYDKAIEDCNKAIELNPKESKAYNNRGLAYGKKGQYDKAIEDYNTSVELNPKESKAYNNRGVEYSKNGQYDKAIEDYNTAIELNPKESDSYLNKIEAKILMNKYQDSLEVLKTSNEVNLTKNQDAILLLLNIISNKMLNHDVSSLEDKLNEIISSKDLILSWDFEDLDKWVEKVKDKNKREFIINKISILKKLTI